MADSVVIVVPGMSRVEPDDYLQKLVAGLDEHCASHGATCQDTSSESFRGRRIAMRDSGAPIEMEFTEACFADLRPRLSAEPAWKQIPSGLLLFAYWFGSPRVLGRAIDGKYMAFGVIATLGLTAAWYLGAVATLLTAVAAQPGELGPLEGLGTRLAEWAKAIGGWKLWMVAVVIAAAFPVKEVVDVSDAAMAYLRNRSQFATKARARLLKALHAAVQRGASEIVVVAHSFGAAVAVDALAGFEPGDGTRVRLVTLGGPLRIVMARSQRMHDQGLDLLERGWLSSWSDFWSPEDWLGTRTPDLGPSPKLGSHRLEVTASLEERLTGKTHDLYFAEPSVYRSLLQPARGAEQERGATLAEARRVSARR